MVRYVLYWTAFLYGVIKFRVLNKEKLIESNCKDKEEG